MQPIRQVIHNAPEYVPIPTDLRHKTIELIILNAGTNCGFERRLSP